MAKVAVLPVPVCFQIRHTMNEKATKWLERCKKEAHKGGKSKGNKGPRSNEV